MGKNDFGLNSLWKDKFIFLSCTVVCMLLGGIYIASSEKLYVSSMTLMKNDPGGIGGFSLLDETFKRDPTNLLVKFNDIFASSKKNRLDVLGKSDLFAAMPAEARAAALNKVAEKRIVLSLNKEAGILQLEAFGNSPDEAQAILTSFVDGASVSLVEKLVGNVINRLKAEKKILEKKNLLGKRHYVELLQRALASAQAAGFVNPQPARPIFVSEIRQITDEVALSLLGERYLKVLLQEAKVGRVPLSGRYYDIAQDLELFENISSDLLKANIYNVENSLSTPVKNVRPRSKVVLILAFIFGIFSAISLIVLRNIYREISQKNLWN